MFQKLRFIFLKFFILFNKAIYVLFYLYFNLKVYKHDNPSSQRFAQSSQCPFNSYQSFLLNWQNPFSLIFLFWLLLKLYWIVIICNHSNDTFSIISLFNESFFLFFHLIYWDNSSIGYLFRKYFSSNSE